MGVIVKSQTFIRATKDKIFWRAMSAYILKKLSPRRFNLDKYPLQDNYIQIIAITNRNNKSIYVKSLHN